MACENDKCEKYGLHHDYENGVEIRKCHLCERDNQPERLNPEDHIADTRKVICDSLNTTNKKRS